MVGNAFQEVKVYPPVGEPVKIAFLKDEVPLVFRENLVFVLLFLHHRKTQTVALKDHQFGVVAIGKMLGGTLALPKETIKLLSEHDYSYTILIRE